MADRQQNINGIPTSCPTRVCGTTARKCPPAFGIARGEAKCPLQVVVGEDKLCVNCGSTLKFVAGDGMNVFLENGALVIEYDD